MKICTFLIILYYKLLSGTRIFTFDSGMGLLNIYSTSFRVNIIDSCQTIDSLKTRFRRIGHLELSSDGFKT